MSPVDTQQSPWRLSVDTATSFPLYSSSSSPSREYGAREALKASLSRDWRNGTIDRKPTLVSNPSLTIAVPSVQHNIILETPNNPLPPHVAPLTRSADEPNKQSSKPETVDRPRSADLPSVEETFKTRRTSISFNPKVTLDGGHETHLDKPVPKGGALQWDTRPRGRSVIDTGAQQHKRPSPVKRHRASSESEKSKYDGLTGQLITPSSRGVRTAKDSIRLPTAPARHPLLQFTVDQLARNPHLDDNERRQSLTSESTVSPTVEEAPTPTDVPVELTLSPLASSAPFQKAHDAPDSCAWSIPRRLEPLPRPKSYTYAGPTSRRSRRTMSRRSSASVSPASAFLSGWGLNNGAAPLEPDAEGREVGPYVVGKQVGFGGFSVVKEAFTIENGEKITRAVKIVRKRIAGKEERENDQLQAEFEHEVSIWRCLKHPNILPLLAVYELDFATFCFTQLHNRGTLFDLIRHNRSGLQPSLARRYIFQLASAIRYLHEDARVIHRDIKLENCLLDLSDPSTIGSGGDIVLCDFGMAELMTAEDINTQPTSHNFSASFDSTENLVNGRPPTRNIGPADTSTSIVGSLQYASPESVTSAPGLHSKAVDLWAFGIVVFALLAGDLPFRHAFQPRLVMMILKEYWDEKALRGAPGMDESADDVVELVRGCLLKDPETRWDVRRVLESAFLAGCADKIEDARVEDNGWKL
ncbi:MAG: hypothetical protein M1833_000470 [Piccolia ochrophora]|nr:MAG: hypothetical protein M1833_000470 [Piccolia ochrophora]